MPRAFPPLPTLNEVLESPPLKALVDRVQRHVLVSRARQALDELRNQLQSTAAQIPIPPPSELAQRVADWITATEPPPARPAINATGRVLDPRLGLPPLADTALVAMQALARGWCDPVLVSPPQASVFTPTSLPTPQTYAEAQQRLARLTGAEAALLLHSPTAALWLLFASLAEGSRIAVARKHLVERPGQVPLIAVAQAARCTLQEVGSANCVRQEDYVRAVEEGPAALFWVATAVCGQVGWTTDVPLEGVQTLCRRHHLPLWVDLGEASLVDLMQYGIGGVPQIAPVVRAGADIVLAAGHGWLGGPPCGLIVGRRTLVERLERHPLFSSVVAGPLVAAAMHETLHLYEGLNQAELSIPLLALIATPLDNLRQRAERLAPQIAASGRWEVTVVADHSDLSGLGLESHRLSTWCLEITAKDQSAEDIQSLLLGASPSVIGRTREGRLLLDLRSVMPRDDMALLSAFQSLSGEHPASGDTTD